MSFQAYLDTIRATTGKGPDDFRALAAEKGLSGPGLKAADIVSWLKEDFALGRGHAMAIFTILKNDIQPRGSSDDRIDKLFSGGKSVWRATYEALLQAVGSFAEELGQAPTDSYISLTRGGKKFAIVQPAAAFIDIGIKLKGAPTTKRLTEAGAWNAMVTHRVRISSPAELDETIIEALRRAYEAVK